MKPVLRTAIAAFAAAIAFSAFAQERVIRIGVLMPISGPGSYFGVMGKEGIELAMEQVAKNPINGYRLQVQYEDSACSPLQATNAVKRVLDQFKPHIMGGEVLAKIDFSRDVNDFTAIATRIASLGKVDVLPTFALEGQTVRLSQALAQARVVKGGGGNAVQMGSIWLPYGYDQKAGQASEGYVRIVQVDPSEKRAIVQSFVKAFNAKYGADKVPTHINAHAYDTILVIADAVRRGATDSESMRDRLSKTKDLEVTTGRITFEPKGQNSDLSVVHFVETQKDLSWKGMSWQ